MVRFLLIFILLSLSSCVQSYDPNLLTLESELEVRPDSVINILNEIKPDTLNSQSKALYSLLITRGRLKAHIFETDDSLISSAIDVFRKHNDHSHLMKALYHQAYINHSAQKYHDAARALIEGEELAKQLEDYGYHARFSQRISTLYQICYNMPKALEYAENAVALYKKANLKRESDYAIIVQAEALFNMGAYRDCEQLIDSLIPTICKNDSVLQAFAYQTLANAQLNQGKYSEAQKNIARKDDFGITVDMAEEMKMRFEIAIYNGHLDQAESILKTVCQSNPEIASSPSIYEAQYRLALAKGDQQKALMYSDSITMSEHHEMRQAMSHPLSNVINDIYLEKNLREQAQKDKIQLFLWFSIILLIVFLIFITGYIRYARTKIKLNQTMADNKMQEIGLLTSALVEKDSIISTIRSSLKDNDVILDELREKIETLFNSQFVTINRLCGEYFSKKDSDKMRQSIYKDIEKEIELIRDPKSLKKIESTLNSCRSDIVLKLDNDFPELKPIDRTFLILLFAGFATKAISLITNLTIYNCYNKRQRLKAKIESSESPNKTLFLRYFS